MESVDLYVDGSCDNKKQLAGGGFGSVLIFKDGTKIKLSGFISGSCTNNIAEMTAIQKSLEFLGKPHIINIYTDSQLMIGYFTLGWSRKDHVLRKLAKHVDKLLNIHNTKFIKVKGHSGICYNEMADELALQGFLSKNPTLFVEKIT